MSGSKKKNCRTVGDKTCSASGQNAVSGRIHTGNGKSPLATTSKEESKWQFARMCVADSPYLTPNCEPTVGALVGMQDLDLDGPLSARRPASQDMRVEARHRYTSLHKKQSAAPKPKRKSSKAKTDVSPFGPKLDVQKAIGYEIASHWAEEQDQYEEGQTTSAEEQQVNDAIRKSLLDMLGSKCTEMASHNVEVDEKIVPVTLGENIDLTPATSSEIPTLPSTQGTAVLPSTDGIELDDSCFSPLTNEPLESEAVVAFKNALEEGDQQLRSVKLCFVGHARAGKTNTLLSLVGEPFNEEQPSTHGIATSTHVPCSFSNELLQTPIEVGSDWKNVKDSDSVTVADIFENGVKSSVADMLRKEVRLVREMSTRSSSSSSMASSPEILKMPCDLLARTVSNRSSQEDEAEPIVMQTWDFAGQQQYYDMVHLFLTSVGIYAFVMNLADWIPCLDGSVTPSKHVEALQFWLVALLLHTPKAKLIIVGTHDDKLPEDLRHAVYKLVQQHLEKCLDQMPSLENCIRVNEKDELLFFPVANPRRDGAARAGISHLRANLNLLAQLQVDAIGKVRTRYLHFFNVLSKWREEQNAFHISFSKCAELAEPFGFFCGDETLSEDLELFLTRFHELGHLLYFPGAPAIILDPQWLLDAMANVINCPRLLQDFQSHSRKLKDEGKLTEKLLSELWKDERFKGHEVTLRAFLIYFDLLVDCPSSGGADKHWLVPSLIQCYKPQSLQSLATSRCHETATLFLDFDGTLQKIMPSILARLLCYLKRKADPVLRVEEPIYKDHARCRFGSKPWMVTLELVPFTTPRYMAMSISKVDESALTKDDVKCLLDVIVAGLHDLLPRLQFVTKVRCPLCARKQNMALDHFIDFHEAVTNSAYCDEAQAVLKDEDFPPFVVEWRQLVRCRCVPTYAAIADEQRRDLRVSYLFASPWNLKELDVHKDYKILQEISGVSTCAHAVSINRLREVLMATPAADVIHISCHCTYVTEWEQRCFVFENIMGRYELLPKSQFEADFCKKGLWSRCKLVVMLTCTSNALADLIAEHGHCQVICCTGAVKEKASFLYTRNLYRGLVAGLAVTTSHDFAKDAIRQSEDLGLQGQAEMFILCGSAQRTIDLDMAASQEALGTRSQWKQTSHWPSWSRVDSFMRRQDDFKPAAVYCGEGKYKEIRIVVLWGEDGIGKSAYCEEFCRFFSAPGGRLFSAGAFLVDYSRISSTESVSFEEVFAKALVAELKTELRARNATEIPTTESNGESAWDTLRFMVASFHDKWLLVVDNVNDVEDDRADQLLALLARLLHIAPELRILLAVRPISGQLSATYKTQLGHSRVFLHAMEGLDARSAAEMFNLRTKRKLTARDFSAEPCNNTEGDYMEMLQNSPIIKATRCVPGRILSAAQKVDESLDSLLKHPDLY